MTKEFYTQVGSLIIEGREKEQCSYANVFHKVYGLLPSNFYKYISVKFGAEIFLQDGKFIQFSFKNMIDANKFCGDINRRFSTLCGE